MTWIVDHWFTLALLGIYTVLIAHHAMVGKRSTKTVADYYVGGRSMGGVVLGLSFFATYSSTNSFVGFAGQSYTYGAPWLLLAPIAVGFSLLAWLLVAPRLRVFTAELDSVTIPDFVGFRFSSETARVVAALIVVLASFLYMTAVFKGIGNLLETFMDMPYKVAIGVVFVVVMAYTMVGGFISVVKTDAVQACFMIVAAVVLFIGTTRAAGGVGVIFDMKNVPETAHLFSWESAMAFPVLLGIIVAGTMKFMVEPRQLSRFYALEDEKATRTGMIVSTSAFLGVYALLVPIGIYAWRALPAGVSDSDLVVPSLLNNTTVFPEYVGAVLMVAMVAAAMSSLDSVLLVMATTFQRDVVSKFRPTSDDSHAIRNTRIMVAVFALVTAIIALNPPGQIVTLTAFSGSLFAACFFPAVVLGLHWRRGTGPAVLASFTLGILTLVLWKQLPFSGAIHQVFPALLLSTGAYVAISLMSKNPTNPKVTELFEKNA
jgi:SSS family transporter